MAGAYGQDLDATAAALWFWFARLAGPVNAAAPR
jgi:hypothetical protein